MTPVLVILIPLTGAFLLPLLQFLSRKIIVLVVCLAGGLSFLGNIWGACSGWLRPTVHLAGGWPAHIGIALIHDPLSSPFLLLAALGFGSVLICSFDRTEKFSWRFHVLLFLSWAAVNGILSTGDLFNLYVFYEIFSVSAYLLVAFSTMEWQAIEAGFKYLVFGTVGAMFFLFGTTYLFLFTGYLNMARISEALMSEPRLPVFIPAACFFIALSIKTGAFPSHFWLPDAHSSAKSLVSALLSGVLVMVSIYVFIRLFSVVFIVLKPLVFPLMLGTGSLSLLTGHLMALRQNDIKRLLAYSTVAHLGYILIGLGCASAAGFNAAIYHAFNHMAAKMGLFLTAGILASHAGTRKISELSGLGWDLPFVSILFVLFTAVLVGVPPLNGFMSKWYITLACVERNQAIPALLIILGTVISSGYYLRIIRRLFSGKGTQGTSKDRGATWYVVTLMGVLCILLSLLPLFPVFTDTLHILGNWIMDISMYKDLVMIQ